MEYGGLKPILPCLGGRSDAACRVVVKRMREEHFNHALPVLVVMRFLWGGLCGVFLPLAGVCGRRGFWAWACACDSRYARARAGAEGRRSASRAKAPGTFARGELSFPPFFGDPKKGGAGVAGARSPRGKAWAFLRLALRPWQDLHERFGTVRAGTRGWAGNSRPAPTAPPLPRTR